MLNSKLMNLVASLRRFFVSSLISGQPRFGGRAGVGGALVLVVGLRRLCHRRGGSRWHPRPRRRGWWGTYPKHRRCRRCRRRGSLARRVCRPGRGTCRRRRQCRRCRGRGSLAGRRGLSQRGTCPGNRPRRRRRRRGGSRWHPLSRRWGCRGHLSFLSDTPSPSASFILPRATVMPAVCTRNRS